MVSLIVYIIVLGVIYYLVSLIPIPAPFITIVKVVFIILAVLAVLNAFGFVTGLPQISGSNLRV